MLLFELFWTPTIMSAIVLEANLYATTRDALGKTIGGENWEEFAVLGLRAFMAMAIYMGMKKQPNYRTYWMQDSFFFCPKISSMFTRQRFMDLRRCLHVMNRREYGHIERTNPRYDKVHQTC